MSFIVTAGDASSSRWIPLIGCWLTSAYVLVNAIVALQSPAKWLGAWWTAKRGHEKDDPDSDEGQSSIAAFGAFCAVAGTALLLVAIRLTIQDVQAFLAGRL